MKTLKGGNLSYFLLSMLLSTLASQVLAEPSTANQEKHRPMYITDDLSTVMRAGKGRQYKIIRYLYSGTQLEVLSISNDKTWYKVRNNDKEGWVEGKDLMPTPGLKSKLAKAESKLANLTSSQTEEKITLKKTQEELNSATNTTKSLEKELTKLKQEYQSLKSISKNAIHTQNEYQRLIEEVTRYKTEISELETRNAILRNDRFNEGIYRGIAAVAFGVLITLFCQRAGRREKRDAWS